MPTRIKALIIAFRAKRHPLASGIELSELMPLAKALQSRFAEGDGNLDFSFESMNRLQAAAVHYAQQAADRKQRFTNEDHLRIVREIAAYLGSVFLQSLDATWQNSERLLDIAVVKEGRIVVEEDGERSTWHRLGVCVGTVAADAWQAALSGQTNTVDLVMWRS